VNDDRVDNRADADAAIRQVMVGRIQHGCAQIVLLQHVTEVQDGGLVRRRCTAQVHALWLCITAIKLRN
jgi:hypothetical protein